MGKVAYKFALPADAKVHPVFHVSQHKKHLGIASIQSELPIMDAEGLIMKEPIQILARRISKKETKLLLKF